MRHSSNSLLTALVFASLASPIYGQAGPKASQSQHLTKSENEVILKENSAQEANLKIEPVIEMVAPTTAPLNGKITFDETIPPE